MLRILLAAVAAVGLSPAVRAADKPAELSLIPPAAQIAITLDGVKWRKNLAGLGVPVEKIVAKAKDEKKIDLEAISRVTLFVELFSSADAQALPTVVITTKGANAGLPKWLESDTEATIADKKAIKSREKVAGQDMYGIALDDTTVLYGTNASLTTVLKGDLKATDLSTMLGNADLSHDIVAVMAMKPLVAKLKDRFDDRDKLEPPFWTATKRLESILLTVDLAGDTLLKGVFVADNAEGANLVKESLRAVKLLLPSAKDGIGEYMTPEAKPLIMPVLDAIAKDSKVTIDDNRVIMTVARPKDFGK